MQRIPRWLKWAYTAFVGALVPVYVRQYGWRNFLWFSDVALIATVPALWFERPLLASMQAVSVVVPESGWTIDFVTHQMFRVRLIGLADYMFDRKIPRSVRALSLFHLWLPPLLLWMLNTLGYDRRAIRAQTASTWALLVATYALTDPSDDINWVYGLSGSPQRSMSPRAYLLLVMAVYPIAFHWPAHAAFRRLFSEPADVRKIDATGARARGSDYEIAVSNSARSRSPTPAESDSGGGCVTRRNVPRLSTTSA